MKISDLGGEAALINLIRDKYGVMDACFRKRVV